MFSINFGSIAFIFSECLHFKKGFPILYSTTILLLQKHLSRTSSKPSKALLTSEKENLQCFAKQNAFKKKINCLETADHQFSDTTFAPSLLELEPVGYSISFIWIFLGLLEF